MIKLVSCFVLCISAAVSAEEHWAFQPLRPVRSSGIDELVERELVKHGLTFSPRADARTLLRRASFDLTGLPPSDLPPETWSADDYAAHVDRLLASPHHGEHWARHWLDVARYSDTKGYV